MVRNRTWLAFADENICNHSKALKELGFVNWTTNVKSKFAKDDIVYLFMSDDRSVRFKLKVDEVEVQREDGDYWSGPPPNDNTYKLKLVAEYSGNLLKEGFLKSMGFRGGSSISTPSCNNAELLEYINDVFAEYMDNDFDFQKEIQNVECDEDLSDTSKKLPNYREGISGKIVVKKASVSKQALKKAEFKCEFDNSHCTFLTDKGVHYMEGHHLIPCTASNTECFWSENGRNIDCVENIICLCPTCHRRIHFGSKDEKYAIIRNLYNKRKSVLQGVGIDISIDEILELYKLP